MTKRAATIITAGFFTVFIAYAIRYGYGMLLPEMLPAFHITKTEAGVIYSSYFLAYTLFSPVVGFLSDRCNVRIILVAFTLMLGAGSVLMAFATSVLTASIYFTLAGIGHAACWGPVVAQVQKWVPNNRRGAALALTTMGSQSGIAFWSLLLPKILQNYNWQWGWICMGSFGLGVAALNYLLLPNEKAIDADSVFVESKQVAVIGRDAGYLYLLKSDKLWFIGLAYMGVGFTVLVPTTFFCVYATSELNLPYAVATANITVIAGFGMIGKLVLGFFSDKWGRIPVMIFCGLLMGCGCWGMAATRNLMWLYVFSGIYGLGFGAVWPVYAAAAPDFFNKDAAGSVIGLWTVFLGVGSIFSPVLCGWAIDTSGTYTRAFIMGMIVSLSSTLFLVPVLKSSPVPSAEASSDGLI